MSMGKPSAGGQYTPKSNKGETRQRDDGHGQDQRKKSKGPRVLLPPTLHSGKSHGEHVV
jgi:hypothetical protein